MLYPKERRLWITGAHRGARGTLDEFKAAWGGRQAHNGDPPKILGGNLVPATVTDRRIGLQPYAPGGSGWLVCNLGLRSWRRPLPSAFVRHKSTSWPKEQGVQEFRTLSL